MTHSWGDPEPTPTWSWDEVVNHFLIFVLGGTHPQWTTSYGTKPAPRGTVIMLTGPRTGEIIQDRLLLSSNLAGALKDKPPGFLLVTRVAKNGKAITFEAAGDYGRDLANRWAMANPGRLDAVIQEAQATFWQAASRPQQQPAQQVPASPQFQQPPPQYGAPAYAPPQQPQQPYAPPPPQQFQQPTYAQAPQQPPTVAPYAFPPRPDGPPPQAFAGPTAPVTTAPDIATFPATGGPTPATQPEQPPF